MKPPTSRRSKAPSEASGKAKFALFMGRKIKIRAELMEKAIDGALKAVRIGGGPFGAQISDFEGNVVSCSSNSVVNGHDPSAHAEVNAIRAACCKLKTHVLDRHIIYSTCEPCLMCRGAIYWAKIPVIVYAASQEDARRAGFDELNITDEAFEKIGKRKMAIVRHFMRKEALEIFRQFRKAHGQMY